jgi:FtsZ-binding cell division protein ZapB
MVKTAATTRSVELEPIDRLEEKVKRLVDLVERMKAENAQASEENRRLAAELDTMREQMTASESINTELTALKEERSIIRSRVGEMLDQLEALNL